MRNTIILSLVCSISLLMTGCAVIPTQHSDVVAQPTKQCRFIERNLTKKWDNRSYWCIPQVQ